ncbi:MAG: hypothetical protein M3R46_14620, partial [Actinomycetota bacterium]|nr:hypothetical protein [Actinomycetota bacterium]
RVATFRRYSPLKDAQAREAEHHESDRQQATRSGRFVEEEHAETTEGFENHVCADEVRLEHARATSAYAS